jgi:hypothetical protein
MTQYETPKQTKPQVEKKPPNLLINTIFIVVSIYLLCYNPNQNQSQNPDQASNESVTPTELKNVQINPTNQKPNLEKK